jgi:hypothetical protein
MWLAPWLTVELVGGASVIERDAWMTGVDFAVHTHSYGWR